MHAWNLVSQCLTTADEVPALGLYRFTRYIWIPHDELKIYTQPLLSQTTEFLAHLSISGDCQFGTREMLCLADLKNLGVLELMQPKGKLRSDFPDVNDRLLRAWAEVDDPFPLLRILRIRVERDITQNSLRWVTKFPSLAVYDVITHKRGWKDAHAFALEHGWETARLSSRVDYSLLRYMMLLAPVERRIRGRRLRDLDKRVNADLRSLCRDSRRRVELVADRRAPPLLDYLTGTAEAYKRASSVEPSIPIDGCEEEVFEDWAFWLYSFIGQISGDEDLQSRGYKVDTQAVVGRFVLPIKPMASLFLGCNDLAEVRGFPKTKQLTFIRSCPAAGKGACVPPCSPGATTGKKHARTHASSDGHEPCLRSNKRQRLDDLVRSITQ